MQVRSGVAGNNVDHPEPSSEPIVAELPYRKETKGAVVFEIENSFENMNAQAIGTLYLRKKADDGVGTNNWGRIPTRVKVTVEPIFE